MKLVFILSSQKKKRPIWGRPALSIPCIHQIMRNWSKSRSPKTMPNWLVKNRRLHCWSPLPIRVLEFSWILRILTGRSYHEANPFRSQLTSRLPVGPERSILKLLSLLSTRKVVLIEKTGGVRFCFCPLDGVYGQFYLRQHKKKKSHLRPLHW